MNDLIRDASRASRTSLKLAATICIDPRTCGSLL